MVKDKIVKFTHSQLLIPLLALCALMIFNLFRDPSFFEIRIIQNSYGNLVLSGNLIRILNGASELAILALGMTLVTSASKGQDISVGAMMAIAGSVYVKIVSSATISWPLIIGAFLASCLVAVIFGAFNGSLVAVFKVQPMIATLILFTIGRSIAYWINGGATPVINDLRPLYAGGYIPGVAVPTSIFIVIVFGILMALLLKLTNLSLYAQAVGANENAAGLNGIDPVKVKFMVFIILALCVAVASPIAVGRLGLINHETIGLGIEMDAILAVAIGGNSLGGGKFKMSGSLVGAYVIEGLTRTLYAMGVPSTDVRAYKAVVIIILVVISSPLIREWLNKLGNRYSEDHSDKKLKEDG